MAANLSAYTPQALSVLRNVTAFLFVQHGTAKFFGLPHVAQGGAIASGPADHRASAPRLPRRK
ncbi:MAG: hypothetical protein U1F15_15355 [Burkholderiales bacterium]